MITYQKPKPLQTDDAIFWIEPHLRSEYYVSLEIERDAQPGTQRAILGERDRRNRELQRMIPREWVGVTTVDEIEHDKDRFLTIYRRRAFEQPGYERIETWRAPAHVIELRIAPQGAPIVSLDLRRLSYHGDAVRGALHDGVLYVVND